MVALRRPLRKRAPRNLPDGAANHEQLTNLQRIVSVDAFFVQRGIDVINADCCFLGLVKVLRHLHRRNAKLNRVANVDAALFRSGRRRHTIQRRNAHAAAVVATDARHPRVLDFFRGIQQAVFVAGNLQPLQVQVVARIFNNRDDAPVDPVGRAIGNRAVAAELVVVVEAVGRAKAGVVQAADGGATEGVIVGFRVTAFRCAACAIHQVQRLDAAKT